MNDRFADLHVQFVDLHQRFANAATDAEQNAILADANKVIYTSCLLLDCYLRTKASVNYVRQHSSSDA